MANDSVGIAAAGSPTNYIDNESISTGGSPATVDRQRVRVGGVGYTDLADVLGGDTGQSSQVVSGARKEVTFSTTTNQSVASTDCSNYRYVSIQFTTFGGGTASFQCSNDNSTWVSLNLTDCTNNASSDISSTVFATGRLYVGSIPARYFRITVTGISGTVAGTIQFFSVPPPNYKVRIESAASNIGLAVVALSVPGDGASSTSQFGVQTLDYNGSTWDRVRIPTKFFTAIATASGDTALWTPTAGKKFRLLRFKIEATADAATSGGAGIDVVLRDATTATAAAMSFYAPATSVTTNPGVISTGWVDLGNGVLSASANQVLNVNLSAALTSGKVRVVACGTEE